jgi:hypothetical protein
VLALAVVSSLALRGSSFNFFNVFRHDIEGAS